MRLSITLLAVASIACLALKLFTAEVRFDDDPTVALIARAAPALDNVARLGDDERLGDYTTLLVDENGYLGETVYALATGWLWWLLPALTAVLTVVGLAARRGRR